MKQYKISCVEPGNGKNYVQALIKPKDNELSLFQIFRHFETILAYLI